MNDDRPSSAIDEIVTALAQQKDNGPSNLPELLYGLALEVQRIGRPRQDDKDARVATEYDRPVTAHDPALCARLVAEAREDDQRMTPGIWVNGRVEGRCHMKHQHGQGRCTYDYRIDPGGGSISIAPNVTLVGYDETDEILSPPNAAAIARQRNNLHAMADQLEAATREVATLNAERDAVQTAIDVEAQDIAQGLKKHLATIETAFEEATASLAHEVTRRENAEREVERLESMLDAVTEPERDL